MDNYLEYAVNNNKPLIITTANQKIFSIKVKNYDSRKVYYYNQYGQQGSILKENIKNIRFKELDVEKNFISLQNQIKKFKDYYMRCLENDEERIELKEELFKTMFDSLIHKTNNNLLFSFFNKNLKTNLESNLVLNPILIQPSNESQRKAIKNALNYKISIIEGPPGTGKTTTILSIIANLIKQNKKVIVVSKNNTAVDNIIEEFKKTDLPEFYIRFGKKEIMEEVKREFPYKINNFINQLNQINISNDDLIKLEKFKNELNYLEPQINELVDLKNTIFELKNQKKFIDRQIELFDFKQYITNYDKTINSKNANIKNINKLFKLINKKKYNFLDIIFTKRKYNIDIKNEKIKLVAILHLLKQLYLNDEINKKETILNNGNLEEKQNKVKNIYQEYVYLSTIAFKNSLKKNIKVDNSTNFINKALNMFPLILTTADGFLFNFKNILKNQQQIDCIIIDEATQCDIIAGLPLLYLTKKLVVVGDSKQLSAITELKFESDIDDIYKYENNNFLNAIKQIFNPPSEILKEHYRCDYNIINFCNKYYYDNQLKIYKSKNKDSMSIINVDQYKGAHIVNKSFVNEREIKTITTNLESINDTFVITPFREQANQLKKIYNNSSCGTIHSFQGKGANNVYFSTVLNDLDFCKKHINGPNNLFSKELINVAISRAKNKFILVCDKNFFENNGKYVPDLKNLIDYIDIYGNEIKDKSVCIFDYLYKNIKYYNSTKFFDNQYEEKLFYSIVNIIDNSPYKCYPKLLLTDLVNNSIFLNNNPNIKQYILNGAHADFTIIDARINKPVLVIELDGKYHELEKQKIHDEYKNKAIEASNIKMLRIPSKSAIDKNDLKKLILDKIHLELN